MSLQYGDIVHKSQCSCFSPCCVLGAFQSTSLSYLDPLGLQTFDKISSRPSRSSALLLIRTKTAAGLYGEVMQYCWNLKMKVKPWFWILIKLKIIVLDKVGKMSSRQYQMRHNHPGNPSPLTKLGMPHTQHQATCPHISPQQACRHGISGTAKVGARSEADEVRATASCYVSQASKMMDGTIGTKQSASVFHLTLSADK